jgi:hypothetical protein
MRGLTVTSNYLPDPQVNGVNCWEAYGFKREFETMVISSEAFSGENERSTTRVSNLEQMKTPRAPYSLALTQKQGRRYSLIFAEM